jgi:dTDP-4-dehydrorhamnose reductase
MTPYRILLTGCKGQLGSDLMVVLAKKHDIKGIDIDDFDLRDKAKLSDCIKDYKPDIIIHPAAYTDVDGCESNPELAMEANSLVPKNIAALCKETGANLIFYSTDYVFDGQKKTPYVETDKPCPRTIYGKSKLEAENNISESIDNFAILRIAWLYGIRGKNFPKTIIKAGLNQLKAKRENHLTSPLKIVDDQVGNPTWTIEVVKQTEIIIENSLRGIFHCTAEGQASWYRLTKEIFELLQVDIDIEPCTTEEFPRPAPRPPFSSLENKRLKEMGLNVMRPYKEALEDFLSHHGGELLRLNQS